MQNITLIPIRHLRLRRWILHPGHGMPLQQILPIRRRGRADRIPDRHPAAD